MADPEMTGGNPEPQDGDGNRPRDTVWSLVIDVLVSCVDVLSWLIGGVVRVFAWTVAAVLSSCN